MKNGIFLCLVILWVSSMVCQQTQSDTITYLDEVVLTDPAVSRGLGITEPQTLGLSTLETYGPVATAATLNQLPGVYVLSGALNTNRITIRGVGSRTPFGTDKIRLYYQNIPVTNGTGFSTIEAFDLENLYAIDVVKGPKASAFGAALGGAILMRLPPGIQESQFQYRFTAGSYGLIKNNLSLRLAEENATYFLALNQMNTEGYRENNSFYRKGFLFNPTFRLSQSQQIQFLLNYIDYNAQIPSSLSLDDFENNPKMAAANWKAARGFEDNRYSLLGLTHEVTFQGDLTWANSVFYSYLDHYEPRPFNILDEFTNAYGFRSVVNGELNTSGLQYYFGMELYKDEYNWATYENLYRDNNGMGSLQGDLLSDNEEFRRQFFAFGTLNFPLGSKTKAQLGLQTNRTVYDYRDRFNVSFANKNARREFKWLLLPSLELIHNPSDKFRINVAVSRGFSNPSLEETLTPSGIINPDIDQEKGVQIEVGASWFPGLNTQLEFTIYEMYIQDLLVAERVGEDQFIGRNAGKTRLRGLELGAAFNVDLSSKSLIKTRISYTYNAHRFKEFVDEDEDFSGNDLTGVPANRLHLNSALLVIPQFELGLTYDYVDKIPLTDANDVFSESYNLFNARARYRSKISNAINLEFSLGLNNIFNSNYAQSVLVNAVGFGGASPRYYYPGNGRNFHSGIALRWTF